MSRISRRRAPLLVASLAAIVLLTALGIPDARPDEETPEAAAKPTLQDLAWLAGRWHGRFFDSGPMEETWLPALGNSMVGTFRAARGDRVFLYEMLAIEEDAGTLFLRMLHFDAGLKAWASEASGTPSWPLLSHEKGKVVFEDLKLPFPQRMVYALTADGGLEIRLEGTQQGQPHAVAFRFARAED